MSRVPDYAELYCLSNFSFLRGASHPEELVAQASALGYKALAITDECSLAGVVRAHVAARDNPTRIIIGSHFKPLDGPTLVLLAPDRHGYGQLSKLITLARRRADKGEYQLVMTDVYEHAGSCLLIAMVDDGLTAEHCRELRNRFNDRAWLGVSLLRRGDDAALLQRAAELSRQYSIPLTACGNVLMHRRGRRSLQNLLTAIRLNTPVAELGHAIDGNGERHLRQRETLAELYPESLLRQGIAIADRCRFSLDELRYEYPREIVPDDFSATSWLRHLVYKGAQRRWSGALDDKLRGLIEHELALIAELQYEPYFLTVYDIVRFARRQKILCQGRGSAANSIVCFCLGITEVDPARIEVLFERFISRERNEPPDIDVDFENDRREEVIQYLYNKYGRHRAALVAAVISYKPKSAIRDVGKAMGLGLDQLDRLSKSIKWWDGKCIAAERLREAGLDPDSDVIRRIMLLVTELLGFPRHLSQHVGGFVIARDELSTMVPIENAAMTDRTVIQWDKDDIDALGLLKIDCLALGMLTAIRRCFDLIHGFDGRRLTMATIPAEDPGVYAMIQQADTVGVFQIESRAQMAMLPRLKPACFYDLVIEVAIVRPGPIQGDMVHPYLRRRQGKEAVSYPSDDVRDVLRRTLGVPIFQEQVIKLAMVAAGFSPGEADHLRRSMAAWRRRGGLDVFEQRLIDGMAARGYSENFARQIFAQIQGFGEYGFPESHAASFALLVYVSAWLKRHEPAAFCCALLNSQPMGFYAPAQLIQDAQRHGVEIRPVDVLTSDWLCTLEKTAAGVPAVRLGLCMVGGLSSTAAGSLVALRQERRISSVNQLVADAGLNRKELNALAAADALRSLSGNRHKAYWQADGIMPASVLLKDSTPAEASPLLRRPTEAEDIVADYASLGLSLHRHPLALLRARLQKQHVVSARDLLRCRHDDPVRIAGLVISRQRPGTATGVIFVTLEDETGISNIIVHRKLIERQRSELLDSRLMRVDGVIQREGRVIHVLARRLYDYSGLIGELLARSRDFH